MKSKRRPAPDRFRGLIEPLEERLLFNADVLAAMAVEPSSLQQMPAQVQVVAPAVPVAASQQQASAHEIVFVDAAVEDAQALIDGILGQPGAEDRFEIHWLAGDQDGVTQIGAVLAGRQDVAAVHLISHGTDGQIKLGATFLNSDTLAMRADEVSGWAHAFQADGDILVYGCDVAATDKGQAFARDLALLTGADVAASTDATGASSLGGDWTLEFGTGRIEALIAADAATQASWAHVLALNTSGGETRVNSTTTGTQSTSGNRQVGVDASGNHVVVWQDGSNVQAKVMNASGGNVVGGFTVAAGTDAQVAMNASGQFVVVWKDGSNGVKAQRFNANGSTSGGVITVSSQSLAQQPAIAMNDAGNFAITWSENYTDFGFNAYREGYVAVYSWSGTVQAGTVFSGGANNNYTDNSDTPMSTSVAMNSSGKFVVVTERGQAIINQSDIWLWTFNANGSSAGISKQQVNTSNINGASDPSVGLDDSGNIAITWTANNDIYTRRATFSGGVTGGSDARVNSVATNNQTLSSVGMNVVTGRYVVVYQDSSGSNDIYMREYDATGTAVATEARVNTTTNGAQGTPSAAYNGNHAVVVWSGNGEQSGQVDTAGVFAQRYSMTNAAPVNTVPSGLQYGREDTAKVFSSGNGNAISISDADAGSGQMEVTLSATSGRLTLSGTAGLSFTVGSGTADTTMTFRGTVAAINTALNGLSYLGNADFNGMAQIAITTSDLGNTGNGGAKTDSDTIDLLIAPVNETTVNTVPGAQGMNEDGALVFSAGNGNAITVNDPDAASVQITLTATQGVLTLSQLTGLTFTSGDGTQDAAMTFSGTLANVNAALNGLLYAPNADYNGTDTITVASQDRTLVTLNVDTSLKGRYAFENTGALGTDSSPSGNNNATITNVTATNDATRGNVASMNGTGNIQIGSRMGQPTNVTVAAWVKVTTDDVWGTSVITIGDTINLVVDESFIGDKLAGYFHDGSSYYKTNFDVTLAGTGWHHVAYSVDSANNVQVLYLDGVAVATTNFTQNVAYNRETITRIGKFARSGFDNGHDLTGSIDEARIYSRALSAAEIAALASDLPAPNTDTDNITVNVAPVNDAPVLTGSNPFNSITEDQVNNGGQLVSTLLTSTDVDGGAASGIAIDGLSSGRGIWQYSLNGGAAWSDVGTVSTSSALLLRASDLLRFVPDARDADTATLSFHAWDQTSGAAGNKVSVLTRGGTTAFSTGTGTSSITVTAVNDAPVAMDDSASTSPGTPVDIEVKANDSDPDDTRASLTVVIVGHSAGTSASVNPDGTLHFDPGAQTGAQTVVYRLVDPMGATSNDATVTITVAPNTPPTGADNSASLDEDTAYTLLTSDFGFNDVDSGQAFGGIRVETLPTFGQLRLNGVAVNAGDIVAAADIASGKLVFMPGPDQNGSTTLGFKVRDDLGLLANAANTFVFQVDAVNDAPSLLSANDFAPIGEDDTGNTGQLVSSLLNSSDPDAGAASGIALYGTGSGRGAWQYSLNGGASWAQVGNVGTGSALLLRGSDRLRFVPDGIDADTASITFHAWDQTSGLAGTKADATTRGGATALSTASGTASITVTAVNDAPVLSGANNFTAIDEDDRASAGTRVAALVAGRTSDVDGGALTGIAVIGAETTHGSWQYTLDGVVWLSLGSPTDASARLLAADAATAIRFVPDTDWHGTAAVTLRAWDRSAGIAGGTFDARTHGGTSAFSVAMATPTITVAPVNDAPVLSGSNGFAGIDEDDTDNVGTRVSVLITGHALDVDDAASPGIAVTGVNDSHGVWQYTIDAGAIWSAFGIVTDSSARLLASDMATGIRFVPVTDWSGTSGIQYRAWDRSNGTAGGTADTTVNGGTTAFSTAMASASITVNAVNDAPVITLPAGRALMPGDAAVFSPGQAGAIVLADVDAGTSPLRLSLAVSHGTLTLGTSGGLTFVSGTGSEDASMVVTGDLASLNAALSGMRYRPAAGYSGRDALTMSLSDQGSSGAGGPQLASTAWNMDIAASDVGPWPPATLPREDGGATSGSGGTIGGTGSSGQSQADAPTSTAPRTPIGTGGNSDSDADAGGPLRIVPSAGRATAGTLVPYSASTPYMAGQAHVEGLYAGTQELAELIRRVTASFQNGPALRISPIHSHADGAPLSALASRLPPADNRLPIESRVAATLAYSTGLGITIGTLWWSARVSGLITSAILSMPAWRTIDPLPILVHRDDDEDPPHPEPDHGGAPSHHEVEAMFEAAGSDLNEPELIG